MKLGPNALILAAPFACLASAETPSETPARAATAFEAVVAHARPESPGARRVVAARRREIVFLDAAVPEPAALARALDREDANRSLELVRLRRGDDGLAQVTAALGRRSGIDAVHFLSHGAEGGFALGSTLVDAAEVRRRAGELRLWRASLRPGADLLVYGCRTARGPAGRSLLRALAGATGADVAGSEHPVGSRRSGGEWTLAARLGAIETRVAVGAAGRDAWPGLLALIARDAIIYPVGNLGGNNGGAGWGTGWTGIFGGGGNGAVQVVGASLAHPGGGLLTTGGATQLNNPGIFPPFSFMSRNLAANRGAVTETIWVSFLLRPQELVPTSSYMGLVFGTGGTGNTSQLFVGYDGTNFKMNNWGGGGLNINVPGAAAGTTAFIVLRLDIFAAGNEVATLYVNPTAGLVAPDVAPSAPKADLDLGVFGTVSIGGDGTAAGSNPAQLDEIRIGNTYIDVAPTLATAVTLLSFDARARDGAVDLEWQTASETRNLGFHLYRSLSSGGPWDRVTASLIPGLGSSPEGARYEHADAGLENGVTYFYLLEDVETTGVTQRHGPVSATPGPGDTGGAAGGGDADGATGGDTAATRVTFGDPTATALRVLERGSRGALLELTTGGFYALPRPDGSVALHIPGFEALSDPGSPELPVRRTWLEAVAGRGVALGRVELHGVESFSSLRPVDAGRPELEVLEDGTVRAGRRRAPPRRRVAGLVPEAPAVVLEAGFQGETKKALVQLAPLRWDPVSGELLLARTLRVHVRFRGVEPAERSLGGSRGRRARGPKGRGVRDGVAARVEVREPGLQAVAFEALFPDRRRSLRATRLRLSRQGRDVPFHVEPDPRRFARGSTLYFFSLGPELNPWGREAVYELEVGATGPRMLEEEAAPSGPGLDRLLVRRRFETDSVYLAALLEAPDPWIWELVVAPGTGSFPFSIDRLAGPGPARIEVRLVGATDDDFVDPDHHVRLAVNGIAVSEASWDGQRPRTLQASLAPGQLREGENTLEVHAVDDTGAALSAVYLDRFEVEYPRRAVADAGFLEGAAEDHGHAVVSGLDPGARLLDTTDPDAPRWLRGATRVGADLAFRTRAGRRYAAVASHALRVPEVRPATPTALRHTSHAPDYVAIGPRAFLEAAEPLLQWRRERGLAVLAAPVEEVFDAFGHGEATPDAIRDFLGFAYHHYRRPPRYVLLLGDASYDVEGRRGFPDRNHVPPLMIRTSYMHTLSDPAYAAVNGEDALPDLAIGRLPAASVEEARSLALKVLAFERDGRRFSDGAVALVADNSDAAGDFEGDAERIAETLLAGRDVELIRLSALGAAARPAIRAAFDRGADVLSYLGHGAMAVWASENVFNNADVAALAAQPEQPLVLTINCLNGYILHPGLDSLAEVLLKAEGKGAVAAISPSSLSVHAVARAYHDAILEEVLAGTHPRLGDALLAAQRRFADEGASPETISVYLLLADPATALR